MKQTLENENREWARHLKVLAKKGMKPHPLMVRVHAEKVRALSN